jgi:hypothetical protein
MIDYVLGSPYWITYAGGKTGAEVTSLNTLDRGHRRRQPDSTARANAARKDGPDVAVRGGLAGTVATEIHGSRAACTGAVTLLLP